MRAFFAALVLAFIPVVVGAQAQQTAPESWKFTTVSVTAGEDALASGLAGSVWMEKGKQEFNAVVMQQQAWFLYGRKYKLGRLDGEVAGSGGHFSGAPWIGPYATLSLPLGTLAGKKVSVSTMHWPLVFGWCPDGWKEKGAAEHGGVGYLGSVSLSVGPLGLSYARLYFLNDPMNQMPGVSYTQKIRKDFSIMGSVTRNVNAKRWMLLAGVTWNP